jgi:hypothetical protein
MGMNTICEDYADMKTCKASRVELDKNLDRITHITSAPAKP